MEIRDGQRLRVSETRLLRRIFRLRREKVVGGGGGVDICIIRSTIIIISSQSLLG
jgi:hypothetical protein